MWKNIVDPEKLQTTIWRMRIACWIPQATNPHSLYTILTAFPLQQLLNERALLLRYTYIACLVVTEMECFDVLLTVHLSIILVINQLDAQNLVL